MIVEEDMPAITAAGIQEVKIRSVLTCEAPNGVCAACYGRDWRAERRSIWVRRSASSQPSRSASRAPSSPCAPSTSAARRSLPISRSSTRTSTGVKIRNRNLARNSDGDLMAMARNVAVVIYDRSGAERAVHRVQVWRAAQGRRGRQDQARPEHCRMGSLTRPILTEIDGVIGFEDLVEGSSMSEQVDEATGIAKRIVIDWRSTRAPRA